MSDRTTVERAFEIARESQGCTIDHVRRRLKAERYDGVDSHLSSGSLKRQLIAEMSGGK